MSEPVFERARARANRKLAHENDERREKAKKNAILEDGNGKEAEEREELLAHRPRLVINLNLG